MRDKDELTRRSLLRASAATAAGIGGVGTASATETTDGDLDRRGSAERVPCLEVEDETETATVAGGVPERASGIRPGSQMFITFLDGTTAGCTANFVWRDGGGDLYIGAAGHCFLPSELDVSVCADCTVGGTTGLTFTGTTIGLGDVVYARQALPGGSEVGHDFGIVRIPSGVEDAVDPSLPQFGGPTGVSKEAVPAGLPVNQYGAGVANGEVFPTMGSNGVSEGDLGTSESWYAAIRASPGDSGSPLGATEAGTGVEGGDAAGILTHLTATGTAGTTMGRCAEMVQQDIGLSIETVLAGER
ncbi:hypothetical protein BRD14_05135 [Halobacteriales archaeon SW_5_68_122]|nr:MAG: hypothetical protein BRD14_05135 [Halobacteriales archaeon SW_5_68_122]